MSAIRYDLDAAAGIREATQDAIEYGKTTFEKRRCFSYEVGVLQSKFERMAARATLASQPDQIATRIADSMDIDAEMAARLIESIGAALRRKYGDHMPDVGVYLGDACQALNEFSEPPIDDRDLYGEMNLDAKHCAADLSIRRAA